MLHDDITRTAPPLRSLTPAAGHNFLHTHTHTHTYTPLVVAGGNYQPHLCSLAGGVAWQPQRMGLISGEGSRFKLFIFSYFNI